MLKGMKPFLPLKIHMLHADKKLQMSKCNTKSLFRRDLYRSVLSHLWTQTCPTFMPIMIIKNRYLCISFLNIIYRIYLSCLRKTLKFKISGQMITEE